MVKYLGGGTVQESLPPRGAWIEIWHGSPFLQIGLSRSPRGERGLKYDIKTSFNAGELSLPPRGAWIEISVSVLKGVSFMVAPPAGSVD